MEDIPNLKLEFKHVPSGTDVKFLAFLESFSDSFDAEWSSDKVFGRMDPIPQYKGTTRKINCSFTVPSDSHLAAFVNHEKISKLLRMMYPTWDASGGLQVYNISAPPLMMVKFNNLIRDASDKTRGLLGYIPQLKYEPDMNSAIFTFNKRTISFTDFREFLQNRGENPDDGLAMFNKLGEDPSRIGWQSLKVSFELNVLHTHKLGYASGGSTGVTYVQYPYSFNILGK